jgi:hypothetical protein
MAIKWLVRIIRLETKGEDEGMNRTATGAFNEDI